MTIDWIGIAITILTTGLFSLIGFVWRFSHRVAKMEQQLENISHRVKKMEAQHDKVMDKVYSLAKSRTDFITKESYRRDKGIDKIMDEFKGNK